MKIYIFAGEASGDLHGKNLVAELKKKRSDIQFKGVGGDGMAAQGVQLTRHIRETNFMGFSEVLRNIGTILKLFRQIKKDIVEFAPDVVVLIDYPGFNLKMARFLKKKGIKVVYYISPTVWAWKKGRVKTVKECVDRMMTILPFEKAFYKKEGVDVDFVGHPLLDELAGKEFDREGLRKAFSPDGKKIIALLPGSRRQEILSMLPVMLKAAAKFPQCQFVIAGAPSQDKALYDEIMKGSNALFVSGRTYDVLSVADYAFVTSGTATLETALFAVPETVCYAAGWLSVKIARWLIQVKYISLVNLIMDKEVVRELIQQDLTVENLEAQLKKFLTDPAESERFKNEYELLRQMLGNSGASLRAAEIVLSVAEKSA